MILGIYFAYGIDNRAVRPYYIGGSEGAFTLPAAEDLLSPGFVCLKNGALLV